jgi:hypothetical protein
MMTLSIRRFSHLRLAAFSHNPERRCTPRSEFGLAVVQPGLRDVSETLALYLTLRFLKPYRTIKIMTNQMHVNNATPNYWRHISSRLMMQTTMEEDEEYAAVAAVIATVNAFVMMDEPGLPRYLAPYQYQRMRWMFDAEHSNNFHSLFRYIPKSVCSTAYTNY